MVGSDGVLLGIDIGTSGLKLGIVDRDGRVLAHYSERTPATFGSGGRAGQDAEHLVAMALAAISTVCAQAAVQPSSIAAVAIDGQMGGIIGVDRDFRPVTGLDMGLDQAAERINEEFHRDHRPALLGTSCGSPRNTPKIAWWKREHPDVYREVRRFTTIGPYTAGVFAGLKGDEAYIDETLIAYFGNEDAAARGWSGELTGLWGIDAERMPLIHRPWDVIGTVTPETAAASGLTRGIPVIAGAGDQPAGFLGGGYEHPGTVVDVGGSTTMLSMCVDGFRPDRDHGELMYIPAVTPGLWWATWYINGAGLAIPWFARQCIPGGAADLATIAAAAADLPVGSDGLLFSPYFGGRQNPYDRTLRGGWLGLSWGHTTAHMLRAIFEGIAAGYRGGFEAMRRVHPEHAPPALHAIGGATESAPLMQITADTLQRSLVVHPGYEASIRGSALLAGVGAVWFDLGALPPPPPIDADELHRVVPDTTVAGAYDRLYHLYRGMADRPPRDTFRDLV
jgi:xylulokinase